MSDHKRGVPITLDRERYLFFSARDAKEVWKYNEEEHESLDQLAHILYIGLRKDDSSITEDAVLDLIDMSQIKVINAKVAEAMGVKPEGIKDDVTVPLANSEPTSQS